MGVAPAGRGQSVMIAIDKIDEPVAFGRKIKDAPTVGHQCNPKIEHLFRRGRVVIGKANFGYANVYIFRKGAASVRHF